MQIRLSSHRLLTGIAASFSVAVTLIATTPAYAQSKAETTTLRIAYLKGTSDLTLAKADGSLEKALAQKGIKVEWAGPFPAAAPAFEALNANAVDLTSGSSTSFVTALAGGVPLSIFAYQPMTARNEAILVRRDSLAKTLADLSGQSVAVNKGGTGEYLLVRALNNNGLPATSVTRRYLSPSDTGSAFVGGSVAGWAIWDPFLTVALKRYDARVLLSGAQIGSENAVGYFVSNHFLQTHPDVVRIVFDVLQKENIWTKAHPDAAGKVWAHELDLPADLAPALGENNVSPLRSVTKDDAARIQGIARWYKDNHIIPSVPDVDAHIANVESASR